MKREDVERWLRMAEDSEVGSMSIKAQTLAALCRVWLASSPAGSEAPALDRSAPERIWLQVDASGDAEDRSEPLARESWQHLTWCAEPVGGQEVEYVRRDLAGVPPAPAAIADEMVEGVGKALWRYWGDVKPSVRNTYRAKTRAALVAGLEAALTVQPGAPRDHEG